MIRGVFEWIANLVLLVGIVCLIVGNVIKDLQVLQSVGLILTIPSGLMYYILIFCSLPFRYLRNKSNANEIYTLMESFFRTAPNVIMKMVCYHYTGSGKHRHRVVTHTGQAEIVYRTWRDISGQFLLDEGGLARRSSKAYIMLELKYATEYALDGSAEDLVIQRQRFQERNKKDTYQNYSEISELHNMNQYNLIRVADYEPCGFNVCTFLIFSLLPFHVFYRLYFFWHCTEQSFEIRKLISTKSDLTLPQFATQYENNNPCITLHGQSVFYPAAGRSIVLAPDIGNQYSIPMGQPIPPNLGPIQGQQQMEMQQLHVEPMQPGVMVPGQTASPSSVPGPVPGYQPSNANPRYYAVSGVPQAQAASNSNPHYQEPYKLQQPPPA